MCSKRSFAAIAAVILGGLGVAVAVDYQTLPTDFDAAAKAMKSKDLSLAKVIRAAEERVDGKAVQASAKLADGKLDLKVEVSGTGLHARVQVDPDSGKVSEAKDPLIEGKITLVQAIEAAEKRLKGRATGAYMRINDKGEREIAVQLFGPGFQAQVRVDAETGAIADITDHIPKTEVKLAEVVEKAEKSAEGLATEAQIQAGRGDAAPEITVEVAGQNAHHQVRFNAESGEIEESKSLATTLPGDEVTGEWKDLPSGVRYVDLKEGSGASPTASSNVKVHYTGWLTDGSKFDSSYDKGTEPAEFSLMRVVPGWRTGLIGLKEGGKRKLVIPGSQAYGERGGPRIPPNATLIFDVELVSVMSSPQASQPASAPEN